MKLLAIATVIICLMPSVASATTLDDALAAAQANEFDDALRLYRGAEQNATPNSCDSQIALTGEMASIAAREVLAAMLTTDPQHAGQGSFTTFVNVFRVDGQEHIRMGCANVPFN